ncbi:MAG: hypothetical protein AAGB48_01270 [Planctomycetota bacterium]
MSIEPTASPSSRSGTSALLAAGLIAAIAWLIQLAWFGAAVQLTGPVVFDATLYHGPTVDTFAEQLPTPDLTDYQAASAPGHHLALAAAKRWLGLDGPFLRALSGQTTVMLAMLVVWWLTRRVGVAWAIAGGLALLGSNYLMPQLILTLPEGSAWLLVAALVLLAVGSNRSSWRAIAAVAALTTLLVFVRQSHLWAAAIAWILAWLGPRPPRAPEKPEDPDAFASADIDPRTGLLAVLPAHWSWDWSVRLPRTALAIAATLPAFAVVAWLFTLWNGPVPPEFQAHTRSAIPGISTHDGLNPASAAHLLAVAGVALPLLMTPVFQRLMTNRSIRERALRIGLLGLIVGLALAIVTPSSFDKEAGRWTGAWALAKVGPVIADRSLLHSGLTVLGATMFALGFACLRSRDALILLGVLAAFTASVTVNSQAWTRYVEPMVLLLGLVIAALAARGVPARWTLAGPLLFAAGSGTQAVFALSGG